MTPRINHHRERKARQQRLVAKAQRTLDGIDMDDLRRRVRDNLNAKSKSGPRWT